MPMTARMTGAWALRTVWSASTLAGCADPAPVAATGDPCEVPGAICTWVGIPQSPAWSEGPAHRTAFPLYLPAAAEPGPDGSLWIADANNHRVVRVGPDGTAATAVGTGFLGDGPNAASQPCWQGCDGRTYAMNRPTGVAVDPTDPNIVWIAAFGNSRVLRFDQASDEVRWWAGTGGAYFADGDCEHAIFDRPTSVAVEPVTGELYISDLRNHLVRRIADDRVNTVAGRARTPGFAGDGCSDVVAELHGDDGRSPDPESRLHWVDGYLVVADTRNGVVRAIEPRTGRIDTIAGRYAPFGTSTHTDSVTGESSEVDRGSVPGYAGDGGPALEATFREPADAVVGPDGTLYIADTGNDCVRAVDPVDRRVRTFAGTCTVEGFGGDGGPADQALLDRPSSVAVDAAGDVFVTDTNNHVIRRIRGPARFTPGTYPIDLAADRCGQDSR